MYPGDPEGPAQEVINCRCFTFAVVSVKKACLPAKFLALGRIRSQMTYSKTTCQGSRLGKRTKCTRLAGFCTGFKALTFEKDNYENTGERV
jgi:hypothetical protein